MAHADAITLVRRGREERLFLTTFSFGHFANDWTAGSILMLTPAIAVGMDLTPVQVGLLITLMGIGGGLAYLPAGLAADYTRSRGLLLLMTFWWVAIGYFIASLAPGYWWLVILLAIAVMGDAAWHPIATGVLTQKMPDRKARALGIHAMGGTIGAEAVAPLAVGFLLLWFDWRTVLQISVLPALVMGVLFIPMVRRIGPSPDHRFDLSKFRALLRRWRSPIGFGLVGFAVIYSMASFAALAMDPPVSVHRAGTLHRADRCSVCRDGGRRLGVAAVRRPRLRQDGTKAPAGGGARYRRRVRNSCLVSRSALAVPAVADDCGRPC